MESLGTIEPIVDSLAGRPEWISLIDDHPQLCRAPDKVGINPFTRAPLTFKAHPDYARVLKNGSAIGAIHWAMDDSRCLVVLAEPGAEIAVAEAAEEVATHLGWRFVGNNAA
jgi:hypothetical protein